MISFASLISSHTLKVMTFNVFEYQWPQNQKERNLRVKSITNSIIESDADIVLIQEDHFDGHYSPTQHIKGYQLVTFCKVKPYEQKGLGNSILVKSNYWINNNITILHATSIDTTEGCPTPRCANYVQFSNGISCVNTRDGLTWHCVM